VGWRPITAFSWIQSVKVGLSVIHSSKGQSIQQQRQNSKVKCDIQTATLPAFPLTETITKFTFYFKPGIGTGKKCDGCPKSAQERGILNHHKSEI
jgi:hypothetical protein